MSSLYQIYLDGLKRLQGIQAPDDPSGLSSDMSTDGGGFKALMSDRPSGSPLTQPGGNFFPTKYVPQNQGQLTLGNTTVNLPKSVLTKEAAANQAKAIAAQNNKVPQLKTDQMPSDPIITGGQGTQQGDIGFLQKLSNFIGTDYDKAVATWKDKGGFEGLMANPAFTLGLAFMQAGAEGKTIGQGSLDNILKAGAISQQYKNIIKARAGDVVEATEGQMNKVKSILGELGISGPGWRKMLPGNQSASYEQAVEDITLKVESKVKAMKKAAEASGKDIQVGTRLYKKIIQDMIDSGEISKKRVFLDSTLEAAEPKAMGGPVQKGKAYVVGEKGPEIVIPKSDGNVLTNDDSQIYAMLLAANPQLQKVSRQRAEKILKARFPEYFEG